MRRKRNQALKPYLTLVMHIMRKHRKLKRLYGNWIYRLNKKDKENIKMNNLFYADLFLYGNYILDHAFHDEVIPDYELTIFSFLYKILELLDSMMVMAHQGLLNEERIILRSLLEANAQLMYILHEDKDERKRRAIVMQMMDIKHGSIDDDTFYQHMQDHSLYGAYIHIIRDSTSAWDKWYCYCEGRYIRIKDLFEFIGWGDIYRYIYRPLCDDTHLAYHMEDNIDFHINDDKTFYFRPFRYFDCDINNDIMLIILRFVPLLYDRFFLLYGLENADWRIFREKSSELISSLSNLEELIFRMKKNS